MLVDYDQVKADYDRKDAEIKKLRDLLYSAERELCHLIIFANKKIKEGISSTDADEPEYYDGQTVSEIRDALEF